MDERNSNDSSENANARQDRNNGKLVNVPEGCYMLEFTHPGPNLKPRLLPRSTRCCHDIVLSRARYHDHGPARHIAESSECCILQHDVYTNGYRSSISTIILVI
eukprot:1347417-Amorphochlora_amoeboformis.AAC.1